jgi:hypothetical protein
MTVLGLVLRMPFQSQEGEEWEEGGEKRLRVEILT